MTPTQRSLAHLRKLGYFVAIVEKWNPHVRVRQDLWGFGDLLAVRGNEVQIVQTTSGPNMSARIAKIRDNAYARQWLESPTRTIRVHGWVKRGARGKRKLWEVREVEVTMDGEHTVTPPLDWADAVKMYGHYLKAWDSGELRTASGVKEIRKLAAESARRLIKAMANKEPVI